MKRRYRGQQLPLLAVLMASLFLVSCGTGLPTASWFGIAAGDGTVYLAANEQVVGVNLESGAELWAYPVEPDSEIGPFYAPPLLLNDSLIIAGYSDKGTLAALSPEGGTQTWSIETEGRIVGGPNLANADIIVANDEGDVFLIERETQARRSLMKAEAGVWAKPVVDDVGRRAFVPSMDHRLYALDLEHGETIWAFEADGALAGSPELRDGVLYFGALNSTFYAVKADTGDKLWSFETEGWIWGGPFVDGETVYFGDLDGNVYALDVVDGSQRWVFEAEGGVRATPLLLDDTLYFGARGGEVYAIRATDGTQKWTLNLNGSIYSQPLIRGDTLLISPHNSTAKLVALDIESGAERWTYPRQEE